MHTRESEHVGTLAADNPFVLKHLSITIPEIFLFSHAPFSSDAFGADELYRGLPRQFDSVAARLFEEKNRTFRENSLLTGIAPKGISTPRNCSVTYTLSSHSSPLSLLNPPARRGGCEGVREWYFLIIMCIEIEIFPIKKILATKFINENFSRPNHSSLSPLYPNLTNDLHVSTATDLHQSFLWLHPIQA